MKWLIFPVLAAALSGCSDMFDGSYVGWSGIDQKAVLQVDGNRAVFEVFDYDGKTQMGLVRHELTAYKRNGMLHLARYDGVVFVYGFDDYLSLQCLSDSCESFHHLGMPRSWSTVGMLGVEPLPY